MTTKRKRGAMTPMVRILLCVGGLMFLPCSLRAVEPPKGVYFELSSGNGLVFEDVTDEDAPVESFGPAGGIRSARMEGGKLLLTSNYGIIFGQPQVYLFVLAPSATVAGDWDLVAEKVAQETQSETPSTLFKPVPSFLRPVESRYRAYFLRRSQLAARGRDQAEEEKLLTYALELLKRRQGGEAHRLVYLDALLNARRLDEFVERFDIWEKDLARGEDQVRTRIVAAARQVRESWTLTKDGKNSFEILLQCSDPLTDLETRRTILPAILDFPECVSRPGSLFGRRSEPNFLEWQTTAKIMRVESMFSLLRGEREVGLRLNAASYVIGTAFGGEPGTIAPLVGVAVRAISAGGLEVHVLNGCETEGELKAMFDMLMRLEPAPKDYSVIESAFKRRLSESDITLASAWPAESLARIKVADAKIASLKVAVAALNTRRLTGKWPQAPAEFHPLLPNGPEPDPFSARPLLFACEGENFVVRSVGPDGDDDAGLIVYDPMNGSISDGDLVLRIPAVRKYPFPSGRFSPATTGDVVRQFPNGLPPDPFADIRGDGCPVHPGTPPMIFSYGPDVDQSRYVPGSPLTQPQYDPTNGIVSDGNLYYTAK